ncbi:MAG: DedA family protein [Pirellulales bacterium]
MDWLKQLFNLFLHLDQHLNQVISDYGAWTYLILVTIIFCETGLVVTPFLPGDSLLFAAGTFAASGSLDVRWLLGLLTLAAIGGDALNYAIGHFLGPRVLTGRTRWLKREYLERTERFFARYGGKAIILARFLPIIRTVAPFLAGVGSMNYLQFAVYNVVGALVWVFAFVLGGYFFGSFPFVQKNFPLVIVAIILISVLPGVIEWWRARREARAEAAERERSLAE